MAKVKRQGFGLNWRPRAAAPRPRRKDDPQNRPRPPLRDRHRPSRDALPTLFGKDTPDDCYLPRARPIRTFVLRRRRRLAPTIRTTPSGFTTTSPSCGSCPPPPVLSNGGTGRGLPISCFLNSVDDSLGGIVNT